MAIQWRPFASFIIAWPIHSALISFWISVCAESGVESKKKLYLELTPPITPPPPALYHMKWWLRWLYISQAHMYKSAQGLHGAASRQVKEPYFSCNRCEKVKPQLRSQGRSKERLEEKWSEHKRTNEWMHRKGMDGEEKEGKNSHLKRWHICSCISLSSFIKTLLPPCAHCLAHFFMLYNSCLLQILPSGDHIISYRKVRLSNVVSLHVLLPPFTISYLLFFFSSEGQMWPNGEKRLVLVIK